MAYFSSVTMQTASHRGSSPGILFIRPVSVADFLSLAGSLCSILRLMLCVTFSGKPLACPTISPIKVVFYFRLGDSFYITDGRFQVDESGVI